MRPCEQCGVEYPDAVRFCPRDGARLGPEPAVTVDPLIGTTIDGRYFVESELGKGGMGYVYAGRHAIIDKRVAIKVLRSDTGQDGSAGERFIVEAKAASKIGHPNIVDITDFGLLRNGQPYFVMEFLDGPTLGKLIANHGTLELRRVVGITAQIARGLLAAHQKGIVHRDLKPENIFVIDNSSDGEGEAVKVVDFGIARDITHAKRLTLAGMVLGTPEYMSPEQATGQPADHRVDIYALGCIMYEMLTGDVPFRADTSTKTLTKHVFDPVPPLAEKREGIPASLNAVVMRTLAKKVADRYPTLKEMLNDLDGVDAELRPRTVFRQNDPIRSSSPTDVLSSDVALPRNWAPLYAVGGALVIALVVGVGLLVQRFASRKPTSAHSPSPVVTTEEMKNPDLASALAPTSKPAIPVPIAITFKTQPAGADIFVGNEQVGSAPVTLKYPSGKSSVVFVIKLAGYQDATHEFVPDRDASFDLALKKLDRKDPHDIRKTTKTPIVKTTRTNATTRLPGTSRRPSDLRNPFD